MYIMHGSSSHVLLSASRTPALSLLASQGSSLVTFYYLYIVFAKSI